MNPGGAARIALPALLAVVGTTCYASSIAPPGRLVEDPARVAPAEIVQISAEGDRQSFVSAQVFRSRFPSPPTLRDVLDRYGAANARLLERGADGAGARFEMVTADGRRVVGDDRYRFEPPGWLEERRSDRHALARGDRACERAGGASGWSCSDTPVEQGLPTVEVDAVVQATLAAVDCGGRPCLRFMLTEARSLVLEQIGPQSTYVVQDPWSNGRRLILDVDAESGDPRRLQIVEVYAPGRVANAVYDYDLDLVVAPFDLPEASPWPAGNAAPRIRPEADRR